MRANRREINIFNMSLLDILCGALGAFCFMMLVALPYYKPATNAAEIQKQREKTEQLMRDIEKLSQNLDKPGAARDLEDLLKQLQAQIQSLQGQVNQLTGENEQLRNQKEQLATQNEQLTTQNKQLTDQNQQLTAQNQKLAQENRQMRQREPFLILAQNDLGAELDLYLDDIVSKNEKGQRNPPFDPTKKRNMPFWPGDTNAYAPAHGVIAWVVRDTPAGSKMHVFVKVPAESVLVRGANVDGIINGQGFNPIQLPMVTLTAERPWILMGTVSCSEPGKVAFTEATAAEREAAWKELNKSTPRPSPATTPSATASVSYPFGGEGKKDDLEKLRREGERLRGMSPSPSVSPSGAATSREEQLELLRRARERRAAQTVSPTASPAATLSPAGTP